MKSTFSEALRARRAECGLSFDALAEGAKTTASYLFRLENGKATRPGRNLVIRLAFGLNLDLDGADQLLRAAGHPPLTDEPAPPTTAVEPPARTDLERARRGQSEQAG